jgi:hypothetical protein
MRRDSILRGHIGVSTQEARAYSRTPRTAHVSRTHTTLLMIRVASTDPVILEQESLLQESHTRLDCSCTAVV